MKTVPLFSATESKICSYDLVFRNELGNRLSYRTVYDCFKRIVKQIGIPEARVHDLRHTFAVLSFQCGNDVKTIQSNLGHSSAAFTLDVYGHVTDEMRRRSAERMEGFIRENLMKNEGVQNKDKIKDNSQKSKDKSVGK